MVASDVFKVVPLTTPMNLKQHPGSTQHTQHKMRALSATVN